MTSYYVYMYLDQDNVPFYIGKGKNDRYKICYHLGINKKGQGNKLLFNKIKKVGIENVKIYFLCNHLTDNESMIWEQYWIKYIGRRDLGTGSLCNLTDGGEGNSGRIFSEEHRKKISIANMGHSHPSYWAGKKLPEEHKKKIGSSNKGHKHSQETKEKMHKPHKTHIVTNETKEKIRRSCLNKKLSQEHKDKIKASLMGHKHTQETKDKISKIMKGKKHKKRESMTP